MKDSSRLTLAILILSICTLAAASIFYFIRQNALEKNTSISIPNTIVPAKREDISSPLPIRLKIPSINVDAEVEYVGLAPDGRVDVPKGPAAVAWFELGPIPGETGSAVVDGHSGWKNNIPAAFDSLYKLQKGDKIFIQDQSGATITFVAREIRSFDKNEEVADIFNSNDARAHLNLITCAGDWNAREKTHSKRLVVFADKEIQ